MRRELVLGISTGIDSAVVAVNTNGDLLHTKILNHSSDQKRVAEIAEYLRKVRDQTILVMIEHDYIKDFMKAPCRKHIYNMGKFQGLLAGLGMNYLSFLSRPRWHHWISVFKVKGKGLTPDQKILSAFTKRFGKVDVSENRDGGEPHKGVIQAFCAARMGLWLALDGTTSEYKIAAERMSDTDHPWPPTSS